MLLLYFHTNGNKWQFLRCPNLCWSCCLWALHYSNVLICIIFSSFHPQADLTYELLLYCEECRDAVIYYTYVYAFIIFRPSFVQYRLHWKCLSKIQFLKVKTGDYVSLLLVTSTNIWTIVKKCLILRCGDYRRAKCFGPFSQVSIIELVNSLANEYRCPFDTSYTQITSNLVQLSWTNAHISSIYSFFTAGNGLISKLFIPWRIS